MKLNSFAKWFTFVAMGALVVLIAVQPSLSQETARKDVTVLSESNLLVLDDEVNGDSVGKVIAKARELCVGKRRLKLFLNTPGGSIQSGLELNEAINGLDCPVDTITLFAASMGFQIAQNLGERQILKNGILMSHRARGQFGGEFGGQNPSQTDSRLNIWKTRVQEMDEQTVRRTKGKQTLESYQAQYSPELWMTGNQSVERGYADRVVTVKCDSSLSGTTSHSTTYMGMDITYDLDNCPINTSPLNIKINIATNKGRMNSVEFVRQNGSFDAICLQAQLPEKLCSLDTSLTVWKLEQVKHDFINSFISKQRQVVPMTY